MRWMLAGLVLAGCFLASGSLIAQEGRVFRSTPETVAIWEMNDLPGDVGMSLPDGTTIPDLSGNGLDAIVEGNGGGVVGVGADDESCETGTSVARTGGGGSARVEVQDDRAFEFGPEDDFSIELYVRREEVVGTENWGILAGTWHSRTLLDDAGDPDADGAWYGYGFIRHNEGGGWHFTSSPINADGTFTPSFNEIATQPTFEVPAGSHYVVATVDRAANTATSYLDGNLMGTVSLPPGQAFITPTGYDPMYFSFLTGVDDLSRGVFRQCPVGYGIDAARVLSKALTPDEIFDNFILISDCEAVPPPDDVVCLAILTASSRDVLVDECVRISGANSTPTDGETIVRYEWKIGDGAFEEGGATREISFEDPNDPAGVEVSLRVTDSSDCSSTNSVSIVVSHPTPVATIRATTGGELLPTGKVLLLLGDEMSLDGSTSSTPISPTAVLCPIDDGIPLDAPVITDYRWDLDSDGTVDETGPTVDLPAVTETGEFTVTLAVENDVGEVASATLDVEVLEVPPHGPTPPGRIFLETDDTVGIWEFNDLDLEPGTPLPADLVIPDLSDNGLDASVEGNDLEELVLEEGDFRFEENTAASRALGGDARVVVNDDGGEFEMEADQDFSIELYVRRAEEVGTENWGILAGTWHSRTLLDDGGDPVADGAWYGYGWIRDADNGGWTFNSSPINSDGTFTPGFNEIKTPIVDIPVGSHYLVATVDRVTQRVSVYLDGDPRGGVDLPPLFAPDLAYITPDGYDPQRFMMFAGEDDLSRLDYRACPSGYSIDAARVLKRVLSPEEILENHIFIRAGVATPPPPPVEGDQFQRGDADSSGAINITDGIFVLNFLFLGGPDPTCSDAADADDSGAINITDGIYILNFLFLGGPDPAAPHPGCDPDPTEEDALDCGAFVPCAA